MQHGNYGVHGKTGATDLPDFFGKSRTITDPVLDFVEQIPLRRVLPSTWRKDNVLLMKRTSKNYRRHQRNKARLFVEPLEVRDLTNASLWPEPNDTLSQASELVAPVTAASLDSVGQAVALAAPSATGNMGAADVDWYHFQLNGPAEVRSGDARSARRQHFNSVLSLYNSDAFDFNDLYDPLGHRLLVQVDGTSTGRPCFHRSEPGAG